MPLLHHPAKKLSHRCWHCNSFSVTAGFSAIVSPHNGAAFREGHAGAAKVARGPGRADALFVAAPWPRVSPALALPCAGGKAWRGAGRKEGFSAFCGLFLCYFCSPGRLLLPKVMILGPYSYLCFCPGAFVGDALGVKPARHSTRASPCYIYSYK